MGQQFSVKLLVYHAHNYITYANFDDSVKQVYDATPSLVLRVWNLNYTWVTIILPRRHVFYTVDCKDILLTACSVEICSFDVYPCSNLDAMVTILLSVCELLTFPSKLCKCSRNV